MRYLSVCSGIEAASVAWGPMGWTPAAFAEVEPFPSAVLMHRLGASRPLYPLDPDEAGSDKDREERKRWMKSIEKLPDGGDITNYGDFRKIGDELYGKVDIVSGGTPCQSYSLAGLRKGLDDPRGRLGIEFVRLCYRTGAPFFLWENVPGVLSCGKGRDFAGILSGWTGRNIEVPAGGWKNTGIVEPADGDSYGVCWRVLDAQYVRVDGFERAVPQRRKRVFAVGYTGDWRIAAAVLLERSMLSGDTPPCRREGKKTAGGTGEGTAGDSQIREGGHLLKGPDNGPTVMAHGQANAEISTSGESPALTCNHEPPVVCFENHASDRRITDSGDVSPTLTGRAGTGGNNLPLVAFQRSELRLRGTLTDMQVSPTLKAETKGGDNELTIACSAGNMARGEGPGPGTEVFPAFPAQAGDQHPCVTVPSDNQDGGSRMVLRRLTPCEAELLQGFPRNFTRIPWRGKPEEKCPDSPRYKALGNSWAVNCIRWIGRRLEMVEKIIKEKQEKPNERRGTGTAGRQTAGGSGFHGLV